MTPRVTSYFLLKHIKLYLKQIKLIKNALNKSKKFIFTQFTDIFYLFFCKYFVRIEQL